VPESPLRHPLLYEINTHCWLWELAQQHGAKITLANVPESEFLEWRRLGFTHLWLMGVWTVGPRSRAFSLRLTDLRQKYAALIPDLSDDDFVGSAYAIAGYQVSEALGGDAGLRQFREKLAAHGLRLILDFIPNHTSLDHPWLTTSPERFVQSSRKAPGMFRAETSQGPRWIAHGRDPYFPPWSDTAQLDYRNPGTRSAMVEELKSVAARCDGVRCDMAMLVLDDIFARTWAKLPCPAQGLERGIHSAISKPLKAGQWRDEFWAEATSAVKAARPGFVFLAEVYWGLEKRLLELGFDFAYDKHLTDLVTARRHAEVHPHLIAMCEASVDAKARRDGAGDKPAKSRSADLSPLPSTQAENKSLTLLPKFARFLENHDEPRIAALLTVDEHRAAALLVMGLPGMRFLHEGQLTGATTRASVHLRRRPVETPQSEIIALYEHILTALQRTSIGHGDARLLKPTAAWDGNPSFENFIIIQWQSVPQEFDLVAVNLAPHASQCYVKLAIEGLAGRDWLMTGLLGREQYERKGAVLRESGLYLELQAHGAQVFKFQPTDSSGDKTCSPPGQGR